MRFNQNQNHTDEVSQSHTRTSILGKLTQTHYSIAGAAIFAIIILHFVLQFTFIQSENFRSAITSIKAEQVSEKSVEIKTEYGTEKPNIVKVPDTISPITQPKPRIAPSRTVVKKKEPRESRAERLRRAEKILTGV